MQRAIYYFSNAVLVMILYPVIIASLTA